MIVKMKVMDELNNIGPTLSKMKREVPFTVPDGYFSSFQTRLDTAIREKVTKPSHKYRILMSPYMAAAVAMFIVVAGGTILLRVNHRSSIGDRFHSEISLVVEQELYSISEETIFETLTADQPVKRLQKPAMSDEMINYLLNEDLSEEELRNPL
jgi:hypothetical protein